MPTPDLRHAQFPVRDTPRQDDYDSCGLTLKVALDAI